MQIKHHLEEDLKRLRLPGLAMNLELRLKEASDNKLGYPDFLALLVQDEVSIREGNNPSKRIKSAGFGISNTFEGFDFHFNEEVFPPSLVRDMASCRFVMKKQNLVIAGPPGIGKTHIVSLCRPFRRLKMRRRSYFLSTAFRHSFFSTGFLSFPVLFSIFLFLSFFLYAFSIPPSIS